MVQAGRDSRLVAEIPAQMDHGKVRILGLQRVDQRRGCISAAVVHNEDLVRNAQSIKHQGEAAMQFRDILLFIVKRNNDTDLGRTVRIRDRSGA